VRLHWSSLRPWDLWAVLALTAASVLCVAADAPGVLRVPVGLAFVLAAPGYAFVAALFPERRMGPVADEGDEVAAEGRPFRWPWKRRPATEASRAAPQPKAKPVPPAPRRGLDPLERAALSLGLSIAIVPLLGLALNFTPWGIRLWPVTLTLALFCAVACVVAWVRRSRLPEDERFRLAVHVETMPWASQGGLDKALTVALVVAVVVAAGTLVYVLATPRPGEAFTEFYLLGPTGKAACYPSLDLDGEYRVGNATADCPLRADNLTVGVANHEGHAQAYWVRALWTQETLLPGNVTRIDRVAVAQEWNTTLPDQPVDASGADAFRPQLERPFTMPPPPPGWNGTLRLSLQLFLASPPPPVADASLLDAPYRHLHLWIRVVAA